ncbi:MAG: RDD family protein [Opitutales bacterium]
MPWFYVDPQGSQQGPVDDQAFNNLVTSGTIHAETLVWQEGMPEWLPYNQAVAAAPVATAAGAPATGGQGLVSCPTCGINVPPTDLIPAANTQVCPTCKDAHLQTLVEGKEASLGTFNFAGFWIRFAAHIIDQILLSVVSFGIGLVFGAVAVASGMSDVSIEVVANLLGLLVAALYFILMQGNPKTQATLGKMVVGVRVITEDGGNVSYARATGRYFATILSAIILLVGYIMAAFDEEKRALHDRLAGTRVVYK